MFLLPFALCGQTSISGKVYDEQNREILAFVTVSIPGTRISTTTDIDGKFEIKSPTAIELLKFDFFGYESFSVPITAKTPLPLEIYMHQQENKLNEVSVVAGENPAFKIIRKAMKHRDENNPMSLNSFQYTSYSKLLLTINVQDTVPDFDTTWVDLKLDSAQKAKMAALDSSGYVPEQRMQVDSSGYEVRQFLDKQHLFLVESVSERKYLNPNRDSEHVIASRVSGLKTPMFTLLATQMQSFSFYDDYISILDIDYLNPLASGALYKYVYIIQDTVFKDADTTFVIQFFPVKGARFTPMEGLLYITSDNWALTHVVARPYNQEGLGVEIRQMYEKIGSHYFPKQHHYDFKFYNLKFNGIEPIGIGRTWIRDVELMVPLKPKDISRLSILVDDEAGERSDEFWNKYRTDTLSKQEQKTYVTIDSIGKELEFDRKLEIFEAFMTGKLRYGWFDFDLNRFLKVNPYESVRLGVGLSTNHRVSKYWQLSGFAGYGFKDTKWKYGYQGDIFLNKENDFALYGGYSFDLVETGSVNYGYERKDLLSLNSMRDYFIQHFDEVSDAYFGVRYNVWPNLHTRWSVHRQNRFSVSQYGGFIENREGVDYAVNGFNNVSLEGAVEYAPNDKYIQGPFGRRPIEQSFPVYRVMYTRSLDGVFEQSYPFDKLDLQFLYAFKTVRLGRTSFDVSAGKIWGDVPLTYQYTGRSSRLNGSKFDNFQVADMGAFETMYNTMTAMDAYFTISLRHNFEKRLFHIGKWSPDIEIVGRALWGTWSNGNNQIVDRYAPENGYLEFGVEMNKIYNQIGLGFYYHPGNPFNQEIFNASNDRMALRLTIRPSLF